MQRVRKTRTAALLATSLAALTFLGASFLARSSRADDFPAIASGELKVPPVKIIDTKLPNGLRVLIVADHTAPVYGIDVCYNVGSRNERPGRTGFAHLFEHMMFEGSENVGKGEHFILIFNNGGEMNGTTNEDRTTYFEELPTNQLDLGLFLESDRMKALAIPQNKLDNQRNGARGERRRGGNNEPSEKPQTDFDIFLT